MLTDTGKGGIIVIKNKPGLRSGFEKMAEIFTSGGNIYRQHRTITGNAFAAQFQAIIMTCRKALGLFVVLMPTNTLLYQKPVFLSSFSTSAVFSTFPIETTLSFTTTAGILITP